MEIAISKPVHKVRPYQLFVLALCIYALATLAAEVLVPMSPSTRQILDYADTAVCVLFMLDFAVSLVRAPDRRQYLYRWGWIDLVSSIPAVRVLRVGRLARIFRIIRVLRGFRATRILASFIVERRAEAVIFAAGLLALLTLAFSGIAVLHFESGAPAATLKTAQDALWWAIATMTNTGLSDKHPVTTEGRAVAVLLVTVGVGLFGTFAGFVASWFLSSSNRHEAQELDDIKALMDKLAKSIDAISNGRNQ